MRLICSRFDPINNIVGSRCVYHECVKHLNFNRRIRVSWFISSALTACNINQPVTKTPRQSILGCPFLYLNSVLGDGCPPRGLWTFFAFFLIRDDQGFPSFSCQCTRLSTFFFTMGMSLNESLIYLLRNSLRVVTSTAGNIYILE